MTTILFVHSAGTQGPLEGSSRFLEGLRPRLPESLALVAPGMPAPDAPEAEPWITACHKAIVAIDGGIILVGHSLGGSIILQALVRFGVPARLVGVVTLATPFWDAPDWDVPEFALPADAAGRLAAIPRLVMLLGEEDDTVPPDHLERYRSVLPRAETRMLARIDHEAAEAGPAVAEVVAALAPQAR